MNLKHLTDGQLLTDLKKYVCDERALLSRILYHLKEVNDRKLYSSLGFKSLFEYACIELKYSHDQAYRRIQAMKLLKELPEISQKIDSGSLNLSHITQAQRFFNDLKKNQVPLKSHLKMNKIEILNLIEHKSSREAEKTLIKLNPLPEHNLPSETKKQITPTQINVNFLMSDDLEAKLEEIKALLGSKGVGISLADLINTMATLTLEKLKENKFGKKWVNLDKSRGLNQETFQNTRIMNNSLNTKIMNVHKYKNKRYLSKQLKSEIWHRDRGQCVKCHSKTYLNYDHKQPLALGGETSAVNLRLLCFNCNQRARIEAKL